MLNFSLRSRDAFINMSQSTHNTPWQRAWQPTCKAEQPNPLRIACPCLAPPDSKAHHRRRHHMPAIAPVLLKGSRIMCFILWLSPSVEFKLRAPFAYLHKMTFLKGLSALALSLWASLLRLFDPFKISLNFHSCLSSTPVL